MAEKEATTPAPEASKEVMKQNGLVPDDEGLVQIDGFADARVGQDYDFYNPPENKVERIAVLPSVTLITEANVQKIKLLLESKQGILLKKMEEVDGKLKEVKYYVGHLFKGSVVHYTDTKGSFRCLGKGKACCTLTGKEGALVIPVPILKYPTTKDGDAPANFNLNDMEWDIYIWKLNDATFGKLRITEKEFPLYSHDIKIKGKKQGKYVRVDSITPCGDALWQKFSDEKRNALIALSANIYDNKLNRHLGRKLKEEEIRELYGQGPSQPKAADASTDVKVDDLVSGL